MRILRTFSRKDGSLITYDYSAEEYLNYQIFMLILIVLALTAFSAIVSLFLIILRLFSWGEIEGKLFSFLGILCSGYFVMDLYNQWILSVLLIYFCDEQEKAMQFYLNLGYLGAHIAMMVLPSRASLSKLMFHGALWFGLIALLGYKQGIYKIPPPHIETLEEKEKRISRGDFKDDEERQAHFDKLQRLYGS